jgi:hypothetical protein
VVTLSWRGVIRFLVSVVRETWWRYIGRAPARDAAAVKSPAEISTQATIEP